MKKYRDLERIQSGQATAREARAAVRRWLESDDHDAPEHVYAALRGWTWKAISQRRMDSGLDDWLKLMRSAASVASRSRQSLASRIEVVADFVNESIRFAAAHSDESLLNREHLGEILECLRRANGPLPRRALFDAIGVHDTYLSQLLTQLCTLGKIEREQRSREAQFGLTDAGRILAQRYAERRNASSEEPDGKRRGEAVQSSYNAPVKVRSDLSHRKQVYPPLTFETDEQRSNTATPVRPPVPKSVLEGALSLRADRVFSGRTDKGGFAYVLAPIHSSAANENMYPPRSDSNSAFEVKAASKEIRKFMPRVRA